MTSYHGLATLWLRTMLVQQPTNSKHRLSYQTWSIQSPPKLWQLLLAPCFTAPAMPCRHTYHGIGWFLFRVISAPCRWLRLFDSEYVMIESIIAITFLFIHLIYQWKLPTNISYTVYYVIIKKLSLNINTLHTKSIHQH